jgi:hypothetical protein
MHAIAKLMSYLSGGQADFLIPLSHKWHGINVAPLLDLIAFGGFLIAVASLGNCLWCVFRRKPFAVSFIAMLLFATAAYAASSTLGNLSSGSAISDTDIFYDVQSIGTGGVKVTGLQLRTYIAAGSATIPITTQSGTTYTLQASDCGSWINFTSNSAVTVTIPATLSLGCSVAMLQAGTAKVSVNGSAVAAATLQTYGGSATGTSGQWAAIGITIEANVGGSAAVAVLQGSSS